MRLNEFCRTISFSAPGIPRDQLAGVAPQVAARAQSPSSVALPAAEHLPPALAEAIAGYLAAAEEIRKFRGYAGQYEPAEAAERLGHKQAAAGAAWVDVRTVVHEQRADLITHARDAKTGALARLRDAFESLDAAALDYAAAASVEQAIADNSLTARPTAIPQIAALEAAINGSSAIDPDDGFRRAIDMLVD
jgi:hypothetical protein